MKKKKKKKLFASTSVIGHQTGLASAAARPLNVENAMQIKKNMAFIRQFSP